MSTLTDTRSTAHRQATARDGAFGVFALILSFGLVMLGLFATANPRPEAATGDPFQFVLRP